MSAGCSDGSEYRRPDITGKTLHAVGGKLVYVHNNTPHSVFVTQVSDMISVGCVKLTRQAWELLKVAVDGKPKQQLT